MKRDRVGNRHPYCVTMLWSSCDRKKDIIKLQHGEYISLWKLEEALESSKYVNSIMGYTDPFHSFCVALIVPSHQDLEKWARENNVEYDDFAVLCDKPEAIAEVKKSLSAVAKATKLDKFEVPAKIKLLAEPWTLESGLVTAALKIKRESIKSKLKGDLQKLYA